MKDDDAILRAREAALDRARVQARADAKVCRYHPGQCFPIQREAYIAAYRAAVLPRKMGRPRLDSHHFSPDICHNAAAGGSPVVVAEVSLPSGAASPRASSRPLTSSDVMPGGVLL